MIVESSNNTKAYNKKENAKGILQIRPIYVDDVNRIVGYKRFTYNDAFSRTKSIIMFNIYTTHYGKRYTRLTGRIATNMIKAKLHNGGPNGFKKTATKKYWRKVKQNL